MKIVTAIDSFKGSLTSIEVGNAAALGIYHVDPSIQVEVRPLADGGEGTVEALVAGMNGTVEEITVTGPFGEPVNCKYGIIRSLQQIMVWARPFVMRFKRDAEDLLLASVEVRQMMVE